MEIGNTKKLNLHINLVKMGINKEMKLIFPHLSARDTFCPCFLALEQAPGVFYPAPKYASRAEQNTSRVCSLLAIDTMYG